MDLALLASERMDRISQRSERVFEQPPPESFLRAVVDCADRWTQARKARHSPNGLIYHYCDANALMNILKYAKVWATSTRYLNDGTELLALTSNFESHADRHRDTEVGQVLADIVDFYRLTVDTRQTQTIGADRFACCFSAAGDLLSQWRAYGCDGRGYAIGFDPHKLAGLVGSDPFMSLRRITYGGEQENRLVDELFASFEPVVEANVGILDNTGWERQSARNWLSMRFGECLFELVDEVKDPTFSEEREWRLYADSYANVDFRASNNRIVPYIQLDLSSSETPSILPIEEIVIGPKLDFDEAVMSLTTFTSTLGYGLAMNFRKSVAPYR